MNTISLRMNDEDAKLLKEYVSVNKLNMSQFIRELIICLLYTSLSNKILESSHTGT